MIETKRRQELEARIATLEARSREVRRSIRAATLLLLLIPAVTLLLAAVVVEGEDLELLPNVVGGNPNDSQMLKLIGDGSTGADRAMTLHNVPTTDSEYRLAVGDNGGAERVTIADDGEVGLGDTDPTYMVDVNGDARLGWRGDSTRMKIVPTDFMQNDDADSPLTYEDDPTNRGINITSTANEVLAFIAIPMGYKATHVMIYGSGTETVTVYESDIDDGNWSASLGSAGMGTEIDITDVNSTSTNFLVIEVALDNNADDAYGGYVTISPL